MTVSFIIIMIAASAFHMDAFAKCSRAGEKPQNDIIPIDAEPADESETFLRIHFISGSAQYKSESSLKKLKQILENDFKQIMVTTSWGEDAGDNLPDIHLLEEADLMLVFTRRMRLPEEQLAYIIQHVENAKPVIGIRTASHAFQGFLELDSRVFGGDYDGHGDDEPVALEIADGARHHSIMKDVKLWDRPGMIYHNQDLGPNTEVQIFGKGLDSKIHEPLAWTNYFGENGRAFYTSMGFPADFENEYFLQMIINAIAWTTNRELYRSQVRN